MDQNKASFSTIFVLSMMSIGLMNHVMVIPMLLSTAKRDSWISVLISGVLFLGWLVFLRVIIKKTNYSHLFTWMKDRVGKGVAWGLSSVAYVFILLLIGVTLKDMIVWTVTSYFPQSPAVNDVLQCPELDGVNCPETDGFTVQNEGEATLCFSLRLYKST